MKSNYQTRRHNLRNLIAEWGGPTSLAAKLGYSNGSYVAQLAGPHPSREISEKVARTIEQRLALPANWLDQEHDIDKKNQLDQDVLGTCVRAVAAAIRDAGHTPSPDDYATLVSLAYEQCTLRGRVDEPFIQKLVRLTIK